MITLTPAEADAELGICQIRRRTLPKRASFKQADVTRAVKGCERAGLRVGRVEIDQSGKIIIMSENVAPKTDANPWDEVMNQ